VQRATPGAGQTQQRRTLAIRGRSLWALAISKADDSAARLRGEPHVACRGALARRPLAARPKAHNLETGETTVAAPDVVLTKTRTMLTIKLPLPGASQDEKLEDLNNFTQEQRGAVLGRSQSWVSQRLKDETQD
jgi:hypothetical protein